MKNWRGTKREPARLRRRGRSRLLPRKHGCGRIADKAVFSGNFSDYAITMEADGWIRLVDNRRIDSTSVGDLVKDVELFQFADGTRTVAQLVNQVPVDIQWNASPAGTGLPGNGPIATLGTVDPDNTAPFTYTLLTEAGPGSFTVSTAGVVTRTGGALSENEVYTLDIRTTDAAGGEYDETFRILTGSNGFNAALLGSGGDDIVYALNGNDALSGLAGHDSLFGQNGDDTLNGGDGNDVLNGGNNTDTASYDGAFAGVTASLAVVGVQDTVGIHLDRHRNSR